MDRRLDFWSAMELSRKMVTRHWWKLFGFVIVLALLKLAGLVAFCLGIFIAAPIAMASLMYAYEDIFGAAGRMADQPATSIGPHGTAVVGGSPLPPSHSGGNWKPAVAIGIVLAVVLLVIPAFLIFSYHLARSSQRRAIRQEAEARNSAEAARAEAARLSFGPVIEQVIQAQATGTNQFLDLDTGQLLTPPPEITSVLAASEPGEDKDRFWQALDIPRDSSRFRYVAWLRESGADLMFAGDGKIIGFDGVFLMAHGDSSANWDDWDGLRPEQVQEAVNVLDWSRRLTEARRRGQPFPPAPKSGGIFHSAVQLGSGNGPIVNRLTRDQSVLWFFKTRDGGRGVLQIVGFTEDPNAARIRYKLVGSAAKDSAEEREQLSARLEAAAMIGGQTERDKALSVVATDAARAGEVETVSDAIDRITTSSYRDQAALDAVRALAKRGLRKEAIQVAQKINGTTTRDLALSELAQ